VEHPHHCLYCHTRWFCHEDCVISGPSVCEPCREKLSTSPDMPRRVIELTSASVLDRLAEREAERLRGRLRGGRSSY
jgi:hypothetical protein